MSDQTKAILLWILIGLIAGWLASFIVGGRGMIQYIIWGLAGSFVGGFLFQRLNVNISVGNKFVDQIIVSTIGAIIVVIVARLLV